jgi:hypothetical protein
MIEAPGLKEKVFIWFVRPFAPRRFDEVPSGVSDEELIRLGKAVERRQTLLSYLALALMTLVVGVVYHLGGWAPESRSGDLLMRSLNPWLAAFLLALGLCALLGASRWSWVVGGVEADRAYRLAMEARHGINVRRLLLLCGLPLAALGFYVLSLCGAYVAFDSTALRWRDGRGIVRSRPLSEIAEVRYYERRERADGGVAIIGDAFILFKDGTNLVPKRDVASISGLSIANCVKLARAAGAPARLNLDVMPRE